MLQLAAAALVIDRARRRDPVAAGLDKLKQLGVAILLFGLKDLGADLLTWKRTLHKKGKAFYAAYPFAFMSHADNIEHDLVVLVHWQSGGRCRAVPAACAASTALLTHLWVHFFHYLHC
ncbi:hypothetical protein D3C74_401890 [compost metagenome]